MNVHTTLDKLTVSIAALASGKNKFFSRSIESFTFTEHLKGIALKRPDIHNKGKYEVVADTIVGQLDPAFLFVQWKGEEYPTIIYHHGNNERPFNFGRFSKNTFKNIFLSGNESVEANLIVLRAPFHNFSSKQYQKKMTELSNFVAMLCVSVKLIEELIFFINQKKNSSVIVSGISLGGWVTNLHRTYYNTADVYVPMLAGAALGEIFISSDYNKMAGKPAQENPERLRQILNFEDDFQKVKEDNVFPLLARYDQIIQYERQKVCYVNHPINIQEKGHITGALASNVLREHILKNMD